MTNNYINDFEPISNNAIVSVANSGAIFKTTYSGNNWSNLNTVYYSNTINCVFPVTDNILVAGGRYGELLKSTNSGYTWDIIYTGASGSILSISFIDYINGFFVTPYYVFKTSDGGNSWFQVYHSTTYLTSINMVTANLVYICGSGSTFKKTINGGIDWLDVNLGSPLTNFRKILFLNQQTGFLLLQNSNGTTPSVFKTINGGVNWTGYNGPNNGFDIYFLDVNTGFTTGANGEIFRTTNGGINWVSNSYTTTSTLNSISFVNNNTGYIVGYSSILLKTTNCGINWYEIPTGLKAYNGSLYGVTSRNGFATFVGEYGIIKSTNDVHQVSVRNDFKEIPRSYLLHQNYPNPFNPATKIKFDVMRLGDVKIVVYDITGRVIQTLVNERLQPGTYETLFNGSQLTSGVYFYRLITDGFSEAKKMLLIK